VPEGQGTLERTAGRLVNQPSDIPSSSLLVRASALDAGGPGLEPRRRYFQHTTRYHKPLRTKQISPPVSIRANNRDDPDSPSTLIGILKFCL